MALKFLNKKGWHTGSLRNIENVWKAEQKNEAEQKKLEELRKQILEERERSEFRLLQEQAGLVPRQERLDFLYDSGLAVGRSDGASASGSGSGFKALEQPSSAASGGSTPATAKQQSTVPGALFEDKPFSSSDAWRKLHSDPLLLIRQREQEALARVKNNPVKMAQIRKSVEEKKSKVKKKSGDKKHKKKHSSSSKHRKHSSDSENSASSEDERPKSTRDYKSLHHEERYNSRRADLDDELSDRKGHRKDYYRDSRYREHSPGGHSEPKTARTDGRDPINRNHDRSKHEKYPSEDRGNYDDNKRSSAAAAANRSDSNHRRRNVVPKLSEEERAARLREMQENAELHEEQRWKRLKRAEEDDKRESIRDGVSIGKNFLDAAQKSVYGAEKGGSSTIEERVRRRAYYSQGREASERNAFRR